MLESFESFDAFRCACPIPNTNSIIDVACPVEEVTTVADTKIFFMGVEKKRCPHASGWRTHGGARQLFPVGIRELENIVCHDEGQCFSKVGREEVKTFQGGVGRYICVHANGVANKEAGRRRERFILLEPTKAGKIIHRTVNE